MELSIIIINYNVTQLLRNNLISLQKYVQNINYEVIVWDNASPDQSWKSLELEFPQVHFIESKENIGFGKANNQAILSAKGEYLLLLNPDTELEGYYLREILDFAKKQNKFGCLGMRMHNADNKFLLESKRSVPNISNSFEKLFNFFKKNNSKSYYRNDINENEIAEVEILTGANLLVKKEKYLEIGGFDPAYFMYGEDIDFCYSLLQRSYKNFYYGKASILHHKGESTVKNQVFVKKFYQAMEIFIKKYYKNTKPIIYFILWVGLKIRYFIAVLKIWFKPNS